MGLAEAVPHMDGVELVSAAETPQLCIDMSILSNEPWLQEKVRPTAVKFQSVKALGFLTCSVLWIVAKECRAGGMNEVVLLLQAV